jgi:hypothetical protein
MEELAKTLEDLPRGVLEQVHLAQNVFPADLLGLEVLKVNQHSSQGLSDAVVELTRDQLAHVRLDCSLARACASACTDNYRRSHPFRPSTGPIGARD